MRKSGRRDRKNRRTEKTENMSKEGVNNTPFFIDKNDQIDENIQWISMLMSGFAILKNIPET